jgi:hypothetical protein
MRSIKKVFYIYKFITYILSIESDHNVPTTSINPVLENEIAIMDPNIRIYKVGFFG